MLYTRYIKDKKMLENYCKNCNFESDEYFQEKLASNKSICVYEKNYSDDYVAMKAVQNQYITFDPTLPRLSNIECINKRCATNFSPEQRDMSVIVHNIEFLKGDLSPLEEYFQNIDRRSVVEPQTENSALVTMGTKAQVRALPQMITLGGFTVRLEPASSVEREIVFIKYDHTNLKYLYMCSTCSTSWKSQ